LTVKVSASSTRNVTALHYLAKQLPFIQTVCETGFNAGHSAFNFLTAKQSNTVHSFDFGTHAYTRPMAAFLKQKYADRFHLHVGDSTKMLPKFIANNSVVCDLINVGIVDGRHVYGVPRKDLDNFSRLASNLQNTIVLIDDLNCVGVASAWNARVKSGVFRQLMWCYVRGPTRNVIALDVYVKRIKLITKLEIDQ